MKSALVRTSYLLSPKLSCLNPFDKTCIDNTGLKIEVRNIAIDRKTDEVAVVSLAVASLASAALALFAVSNYFDPQVPSSLLQLQHNHNRQKTAQPTFLYAGIYDLP